MGFINTISSLNEVPQFEVEKVPVFGRDQVPIPDTFSLQRTDTRQHLGIVGKKYRPIQMEEMIDVGYTFLKNSSSRLNLLMKSGDTLESIHVSKVRSSPTNSVESHLIQLLIGHFSSQGL